MIKKEIGTNAGRIWEYLHIQKKEVSIPEFKKKLKITDWDLYLALGWLAREDKIFITQNEGGGFSIKLWE